MIRTTRPTRTRGRLAGPTLALLLAACGGATDRHTPANTLQRGLAADPETLDLHKARSTEAADILREALERGADTIITVGAVQSNHVRQTAAAAEAA